MFNLAPWHSSGKMIVQLLSLLSSWEFSPCTLVVSSLVDGTQNDLDTSCSSTLLYELYQLRSMVGNMTLDLRELISLCMQHTKRDRWWAI